MAYTSARERQLAPLLNGFHDAVDGIGDWAIISYFDNLIAKETHPAHLHDIMLEAMKHYIESNEPEYSAAILRRSTWPMSHFMIEDLKGLKNLALKNDAFEIAQQIEAFHAPNPSIKPIPQTIPHTRLNL